MTRLISASAFTLRSFPAAICLALWLLAPQPAAAHVGDHPSVHDTVAGIAERLRGQLDEAGLRALTPYEVEQKLTAEERHILGTGHIQFQVDVPVVVTILRNRSFKSEPFWLRESFALSGLILRVSGQEFDVWQKPCPAGLVGLGINSLAGGGLHYLVLVAPQTRGTNVNITELYPGPLRAERFVPDMKAYV
ncbi:MAG TPA: hypothetical protein VLD18_15520, partial [Verrucomicrobiae bacterium]|nr:hypothetical protein [Verrucomicrobiae bacterium]